MAVPEHYRLSMAYLWGGGFHPPSRNCLKISNVKRVANIIVGS